MSEHYDEAREIRKRAMLSFMNDEESQMQAKQMRDLLLDLETEKETLKFADDEMKREKMKRKREKREKMKRTRDKQSVSLPSRRSDRIAGFLANISFSIKDLSVAEKKNVWGAVPGYPVGSTFTCRSGAHNAGVHIPKRDAISYDRNGAYSVCVTGNTSSGNNDHGWYLWYCCHRGRDLKMKSLQTAEQIKDRRFMAMKLSMKERRELRVIRGPGSGYAERGYRYDGLYHIVEDEKMKNEKGLLVYRFRLVRISGQDPLPFKLREEDYNADHQ